MARLVSARFANRESCRGSVKGHPMTWDEPTITEIKMDAELTAYCEDTEAEPARDTSADAPSCDSAS